MYFPSSLFLLFLLFPECLVAFELCIIVGLSQEVEDDKSNNADYKVEFEAIIEFPEVFPGVWLRKIGINWLRRMHNMVIDVLADEVGC